MPALTTLVSLGIIGGALAGVATAIQQPIEASNQATKQEAIQRGTKAEQSRLAAEAKQRAADEEKQRQTMLARDKASGEQQAAAGLFGGRQGTLLTGALGDTSSAPTTGQKTLIGE